MSLPIFDLKRKKTNPSFCLHLPSSKKQEHLPLSATQSRNMLDFYVRPVFLVLGSIPASHSDNSRFIFSSGKKHHSVPYQWKGDEKWFISAHCSAPAPCAKGSPEMQIVPFLCEMKLPLQKGWSWARSGAGPGCSFLTQIWKGLPFPA